MMSDLFILYVVICYLFHLGLLCEAFERISFEAKIGGVFSLIISPISIPFTIGYLFQE
jgi:hypothetical protein